MIAMCITLNKQTKIKITAMRIKCLRRRKLFTLFIQGNFISPEKNKEHKKHKKHKNVKQATLTQTFFIRVKSIKSEKRQTQANKKRQHFYAHKNI